MTILRSTGLGKPFNIEISYDEILADLRYPAPAPTPHRRGEQDAPTEWAERVSVRWSDVDTSGTTCDRK